MGQNNPRDADLDGIVGLNLFEGRTATLAFAGAQCFLGKAPPPRQRGG